jgi:hypothetical protein
MNTSYDADYFIKKFEAIPEEKWAVGTYEEGGCCCALGHCGFRFKREGYSETVTTDEGAALALLFKSHHRAAPVVNDGYDHRYQQSTPKARILAALVDIKAAS